MTHVSRKDFVAVYICELEQDLNALKFEDMLQERGYRLMLIIIFIFLLVIPDNQAQGILNRDWSYKPIKLELDENGDKYIRFIMWHQVWLTTSNLSGENANLQIHTSIRRSRFLAYAQVSPNFLILTHFGLNGLTTDNMASLGNNGNGPQLFLHGAWGEFRLMQQLYVGGGLHYWNGLTRLASQSTLNFMTLDQSRPFTSWHNLGITNQFARSLGVYAKGQIGKLDFRVALNSPIRNPLADGMDYGLKDSGLTYTGVTNCNEVGEDVGNMLVEGYVRINFWDSESTKLPYNVGTYLGEKRVFALGGGFFIHPNGMYESSSGKHYGVRHVALDAFLDFPVHEGAVNAYVSVIKFDYGNNYVGRWAGTGTAIYGQAGYYLKALKVMPYAAVNVGKYDGFIDPVYTWDFGINYFVQGHNAKITLEYHRIAGDLREAAIETQGDAFSQLRLQMHIFL